MTIPKIIRVQINVDQIKKEHLYQGQKGTYLNVALVNTPDSTYGQDYMVTQDIPRELRDAGHKSPILGNAKALYLEDGKPANDEGKKAAPKAQAGTAEAKSKDNDDLPF